MDPRRVATNRRAFTMTLIVCDTDEYRIPVCKPRLYQLRQKFLILKGVPVIVRSKTVQRILEQLASCCVLSKGVTSFRKSQQPPTYLF